jgi:hydrogenase/urease accessory protein HupE
MATLRWRGLGDLIVAPLTCVMLCLVMLSTPAFAHEVRPAYLELRQTGPETYDVLWKVPGRGEDLRLGLDVELPAGCANVAEPRSSFVNNAFTERWSVQCTGGLTGGTIHIAGLSATMTDVLVRLERLDGATQVTRLAPSSPSFIVDAEPSAIQVAATYLRLGVEHILFGIDHLLFILGLLFIVKDRWTLVKTVSSFTVAHSLTLAIATLGYARAPGPPLTAAIALSILYLGPEIVRSRRGETSLTIRQPWVVAFAFGLLHGFGFASGLTTMGLPRAEIPVALLLFNLGVEAGQILFVIVVLRLERACRVLDVRVPRLIGALPAYAVGSLGAYWTIQRVIMMFGGAR